MQAGVIVPTLLGWLWVRFLLGAGCLDDLCRLIICLILLQGLVKVPASGMPSASMPTANMPTTTVRMQSGATHAVAPTSSATSHSGVAVAEVADMVHPAERCAPLLESGVQTSVIVPSLLGLRWVLFLLCTRFLQRSNRRSIALFKTPTTCMPSSSMPTTTNMPTTTVRMQRSAAHAKAPASSATPHSSESIAEVADMVHPTERCTPLLEGRMQAGVIVPTLLGWLWVRFLLGAGCLDDLCRLIICLILLQGLVKVPASGMPSASMPTANMPTTTVRMQSGATHAVAPTSSATSHSGVAVAEVADMVHPAERCAPLLEGGMQTGVIVPSLLGLHWVLFLLCTGFLHCGICRPCFRRPCRCNCPEELPCSICMPKYCKHCQDDQSHS